MGRGEEGVMEGRRKGGQEGYSLPPPSYRSESTAVARLQALRMRLGSDPDDTLRRLHTGHPARRDSDANRT